MSTIPPISDIDVWASVCAVVQHGSIHNAANTTGISVGILRYRIGLARARWPGILPEGDNRAGWAEGVRLPSSPPSRIDIRAERNKALRGEIGAPPIPDIAKPPEGFVIRRNSGQYDEDGKLKQQWIESGQGNTDGYEIPEGHVIKGESTLLDANGNVIVRWLKTREGDAEGLVTALRNAFQEYDGAAAIIPAPKQSDNDLLTVYPLPDLHLGMYAWGEETGADYDTEIATKIAMDSVGRLVQQSASSTKAVILGLGDLFHANDAKAVTPASGNKLDVDTRWAKVFAVGAKLAVAIVDMVARKHKEVEVVFLPGNHDPDAAMSLTVALSLFYSANKRITVCDSPAIAWYYRFGKVLLGGTHGHSIKPPQMALLLATDRPKDWGETKHRSFFFGHIHRETVSEVGPVRVESFSSPAARDAWNASSGYRAGRALSAITYHKEDGEIGRHRVNILNPELK